MLEFVVVLMLTACPVQSPAERLSSAGIFQVQYVVYECNFPKVDIYGAPGYPISQINENRNCGHRTTVLLHFYKKRRDHFLLFIRYCLLLSSRWTMFASFELVTISRKSTSVFSCFEKSKFNWIGNVELSFCSAFAGSLVGFVFQLCNCASATLFYLSPGIRTCNSS